MNEPIGKIEISLAGATFEQTEHCRKIIHTLFSQGIFNLRNGRAILHFDPTGTLAAIDFEIGKWKRDKPDIPIVKTYDNAIIK